MNALTITVPTPDPRLRPNARTHWRARLAPKKRAVQCGHAAALCALNGRPAPRWKQARVLIRYYHPTKRHLDIDNIVASMKHYQDGFANAGVVANDSAIMEYRVERLTDTKNPRVELLIAEVPQ